MAPQASRKILPFGLFALLFGVSLLGSVPGAHGDVSDQATRPVYYFRQGTNIQLISPLQGSSNITSFYGYDAADASPHTGLEKVDTSQVFFYAGSDGISLVFLHDTTDWTGGAVDMQFDHFPTAAKWVVMDDHDCCPDDQDFDHDRDTLVTWGWGTCCADGGALQGDLEKNFEITITTVWDSAATKWRDPEIPSTVTTWRLLTGALSSPTTIPLDKTKPLVIGRADLTQVDHRGSTGYDACLFFCEDGPEDPNIGPIRTGHRSDVFEAAGRIDYVRVNAVWSNSLLVNQRMRLYVECIDCPSNIAPMVVEGTSGMLINRPVPATWDTDSIRVYVRGDENLIFGRAEVDQPFRISGYVLS